MGAPAARPVAGAAPRPGTGARPAGAAIGVGIPAHLAVPGPAVGRQSLIRRPLAASSVNSADGVQ